jgi:hypothetical protein
MTKLIQNHSGHYIANTGEDQKIPIDDGQSLYLGRSLRNHATLKTHAKPTTIFSLYISLQPKLTMSSPVTTKTAGQAVL